MSNENKVVLQRLDDAWTQDEISNLTAFHESVSVLPSEDSDRIIALFGPITWRQICDVIGHCRFVALEGSMATKPTCAPA